MRKTKTHTYTSLFLALTVGLDVGVHMTLII